MVWLTPQNIVSIVFNIITRTCFKIRNPLVKHPQQKKNVRDYIKTSRPTKNIDERIVLSNVTAY